jgi:hypothetical protein
MLENDLRSLWEQRLAEFECSGTSSIKVWCQEQRIRENQFYYWRRKLRSQPDKKEQPVKWLSLAMDNGNQGKINPNSITVHISQVTIEVNKGFDQHLFREIVQVLQTI